MKRRRILQFLKNPPTFVTNSRNGMNIFMMGASTLVEESVVRQCSILILIYLDSWNMLKKLRIQRLGRLLEIGGGIGRKNRISLSLQIIFIMNIPPWWERIGFPTGILKEGVEVALPLRGINVLLVESNTSVSVLPLPMALEIRVISWRISLS